MHIMLPPKARRQYMELKLAAELKSPKYVETIEVSKHHCISTRIKTSCAELLCCLDSAEIKLLLDATIAVIEGHLHSGALGECSLRRISVIGQHSPTTRTTCKPIDVVPLCDLVLPAIRAHSTKSHEHGYNFRSLGHRKELGTESKEKNYRLTVQVHRNGTRPVTRL
ncbi:hypothetical protein KC19_VG285300 [Ceratodon purpureus]|uniref:Uncharacterized protein n=1 Tax=Ceratodon purpureus TaxID=3225 RepID=A0A8T0GPT9_CERPU|nr:hypothetical protein KC19_9G078600 [Ceratodon purpureus]KAG0574719.1 hypothetical protein KC19_VG285300 [Ceratodon purpureus]